MKNLKKIEVYTDGACRGNPGPGGWGAFLKWNDHEKEIYGGEIETTNNRMELLAAIKALECLKQPCEVILHTDSSYLKNGITQWIRGWKTKGWRTANKEPVKNQDLWQSLDKLTQTHQIDWRWVRGHAGDPGNERADRLANKGVDQVMSEHL